MRRVLAAMSGGVDSAVAAARAVNAGHNVTGVHLALSANPQVFRTGARGCCTVEDSRDARRAADVSASRSTSGTSPSGSAMTWSRTSSMSTRPAAPRIRVCAATRRSSSRAVLDKAFALGFDAVCTGHYAADTSPAPAKMHRAGDTDKDQWYVLGVLTRAACHAMFPLGDTPKAEMRAEASVRGLVGPGSPTVMTSASSRTATRGVPARRLGDPQGAIVDESGAALGSHDGCVGFTVGQRSGLRIGRPAYDGRPRYVLEIAPVNNTVTVGPAEALDDHRDTAIRPGWTGSPPTESGRVHGPTAGARRGVPVTAAQAGDSSLIDLHAPVRGDRGGPGGRALRRRHRPRQRHHHRRPLS